MFSLKTIQKKIENLSDTPAPKGNGRAKRKRKTDPKSSVVKKQRQDTVNAQSASATNTPPLNTTTPAKTDVNKNKVPRHTHTNTNTTTDRSKKKNLRKKKRKIHNRSKSEGETDHTDEQKKPLAASSSLPVLYADIGNSSRGWQDLWHDSDSEDFAASAEYRDSSSKAEEQKEHSSGSDSNQSWDGGKLQFRDSYQRTKAGTGQSSDSETSWSRRKHQHETFSSDPKEVMELSSDSERSWRGRKKRQHKKDSRKKSSHKEKTDFDIDRNLIGECLEVTTTERGSVVAALSQGTTLYLQGTVMVCPLLGSVEVLGYILQQGKSQALYSLPSCSLLGVTALEGQSLDPAHDSLRGIDSAWLGELTEKTNSPVLLEVSRHSSPRVSFLISAGWGVLGECRERQTSWHSIGASVVTRENCHKNRVTHILPEWREAAQTVVETLKCGSVPCVVVGGGKGVGKSTFFKYLANTLLSATPNTGVMCLDFDPGQPELSLSTSLSLTHLTQPLLGPAYAHDLSGVSLSRTHKLVGAISPQFALEGYAAAVRELCQAARERAGEAPVLVNTMGWTQGTGLGLMLDVLRLANPTHVIQIQGRRAKLNFPFPLEAAVVGAARGGITTQAGTTELHYSLTFLPSGGQPSSAPHVSQPQALRELRVLAEAGQAVEHGCRVTVPWAKVALHVCEEQVPKDRILQVLNAQLVALCRVDPASLYTPNPDLPQLLTPSTGFGDLLGWAIVMGIDPLTSEIHLATSLPAHVVNEQVNALVMPRIHLPATFYRLFCIGEGPYLKKESREGAGRLRVGRRVKPRGPKK